MYKVIKLFTDLQDGGRRYEVGDTFPRRGLKVSEDRLAELSGMDNKRGTPLIKKAEKTGKVAEKMKDEKIETSSVNPEDYKDAVKEAEKPKPRRGRKPKAKEE